MNVTFPTPVSTVVITEPKPCVQNLTFIYDLTGKPSSITTTLGVMIVVAVVIIVLAVLATIIVITVLVLKNRRTEYSSKNLAKRHVAFKYNSHLQFSLLCSQKWFNGG